MKGYELVLAAEGKEVAEGNLESACTMRRAVALPLRSPTLNDAMAGLRSLRAGSGLPQVGSPAKISLRASVASINVIEPFQRVPPMSTISVGLPLYGLAMPNAAGTADAQMAARLFRPSTGRRDRGRVHAKFLGDRPSLARRSVRSRPFSPSGASQQGRGSGRLLGKAGTARQELAEGQEPDHPAMGL